MSDFPALDEALGKLKAVRKEMRDVAREGGGVDGWDAGRVTSVPGSKAEKLEWFRSKKAEMEKIGDEVNNLRAVEAAMNYSEDGVDEKAADYEAPGTIGEAFVKSAAYREKKSGMSSGPQSSVEVNVKTLFERTAGWEPESTRSGRLLLSAQRPAPQVINSIPQVPISQALYKYMEETTFTNNAAEVAEAGLYPEAALELTERSRPVEKVAVWLPMTDEQLEDVEGAKAYVNNRLGLMLAQRVDRQVLAGNGTSPNLLGTENVVGINSSATTGDLVADIANMSTTIEEAFAGNVSVVFMRPSTWNQKFRLLTTADGQYIWGHPSAAGSTPSIWGIPVVTSMAVTSGKVVLGDYRSHSLLMIKRGVDMQVSNSHSDFFINGKQAIRADLRLVMVHLRPSAFGQITGV